MITLENQNIWIYYIFEWRTRIKIIRKVFRFFSVSVMYELKLNIQSMTMKSWNCKIKFLI